MYTRISRSGGRSYLQIVESFRTDTGAVRQRVIANLGRLDQLEPKKLDPLIDGLNRALGRSTNSAESVEYDSARAFGDVYALHELWQSLGFGPAIKRALRPHAAVSMPRRWSGRWSQSPVRAGLQARLPTMAGDRGDAGHAGVGHP